MSKEHKNKINQTYRIRNSTTVLYSVIKSRAKIRGIEFNLTKDDIVIPTHCPVFNIPLVSYMGTKLKGQSDSISVDRIDSNKGYVKGNIQVLSLLANRMKQNATPDQLHKFADWIKANVK